MSICVLRNIFIQNSEVNGFLFPYVNTQVQLYKKFCVILQCNIILHVSGKTLLELDRKVNVFYCATVAAVFIELNHCLSHLDRTGIL